MPLSQDALQGILASSTDIIYLECLTISHSQFTDGVLYLVNDRQDLVRSSATFIAFPFTVRAPVQGSGEAPELSISADMVDQRIIGAIRSIVGMRERAQITYEVVTKQAPDSVEWGPVEFTLDNISTDGVGTVSLTASFSLGLLNDAFPKQSFTPGNKGTN